MLLLIYNETSQDFPGTRDESSFYPGISETAKFEKPYYTPYRNHTSSHGQFKTGIPQGGVLSPTLLFNIYTTDISPLRAPVQIMIYADEITITSTSTSAAKKHIQPYLHKAFAWTKQNNLTLNPNKTNCTLFTPDHAEYKSNLDHKINNTVLPMTMHPKVLGLPSDPKLTYYNTHIHKPLHMIKALTATGCGKQKETLMATYKSVMRPALEYASSIWSPLASSTSINKLQVMQNARLTTAQDAHKTQTYNICMTKHSYFPYTSTYISTRHNTNRKHNIHHIPYTNI